MHRHDHRGIHHEQRAVGVVRRGAGVDGLFDLRYDAVSVAPRECVKLAFMGSTPCTVANISLIRFEHASSNA